MSHRNVSTKSLIAVCLAALVWIVTMLWLLFAVLHQPERPLTDYWPWEAPHSNVTVYHANGWECLHGEEPVGFINGSPTALKLCRKGDRLVAGFGFDGGELP